MMNSNKPIVAIIGSGPAGLMAASILSKAGITVEIFERKRGPAAKFLIAGKSGLNVSNSQEPFSKFYDGPTFFFENLFKTFSVKNWLDFIHNLGIKTFEGSSRRYFVDGLKSAPLLKVWIDHLKKSGTKFYYGYDLTDFDSVNQTIELRFNTNETKKFDAVCLALGGLSWEKGENVPKWPLLIKKKGIEFSDFTPSNVGQEVEWNADFLAEAEGLPLKNIFLTSSQGTEFGELTITHYGLEGGPIYSLKNSETVFIDLKPDLTIDQVIHKLEHSRENLSPIRRIKKYLNLSKAALALIYHQAPKKSLLNLKKLAATIKRFPVKLSRKRGLEEAISSSGGIKWEAINEDLMLKKYPGIFVAGEMIDWNAPTGGFLIQACVSQGYKAGQSIFSFLSN